MQLDEVSSGARYLQLLYPASDDFGIYVEFAEFELLPFIRFLFCSHLVLATFCSDAELFGVCRRSLYEHLTLNVSLQRSGLLNNNINKNVIIIIKSSISVDK